MLANAERLKVDFRPHIKTHKTLEGARLQLGSGRRKSDKIIVSTMMEAWNLLPLVNEGLSVTDFLYSLPVVKPRVAELAEFATKIPHLRLLIDHREQLDILSEWSEAHPHSKRWSVFIKIDMGTHRAGLTNESHNLGETLQHILTDATSRKNIELYGFYCHAGHSYSSTTEDSAKELLLEEIVQANHAAIAAKSIDPSLHLRLSVGATPTSHASEILTIEELESALGPNSLQGTLELHAGNYCCCDLQQLATGCIREENISLSVIAHVISTYPKRGEKTPGEQLINAGVVALSRESGPIIGYGKVIEPAEYNNWIVGRLSQEHGILVPFDEHHATKFIPIGTQIRIVPQHSCITAASNPWFFIVDSGDVVVDVWVPFRGW